jgi:hypothetical protein
MKGKLYISAREAGACTYLPDDTGSNFSISTSLPGFQTNQQHLVTGFAPGMPLSHDLLAQRPLTS